MMIDTPKGPLSKACFVATVPHERKSGCDGCQCWCHTNTQPNWGWPEEKKKVKFS